MRAAKHPRGLLESLMHRSKFKSQVRSHGVRGPGLITGGGGGGGIDTFTPTARMFGSLAVAGPPTKASTDEIVTPEGADLLITTEPRWARLQARRSFRSGAPSKLANPTMFTVAVGESALAKASIRPSSLTKGGRPGAKSSQLTLKRNLVAGGLMLGSGTQPVVLATPALHDR